MKYLINCYTLMLETSQAFELATTTKESVLVGSYSKWYVSSFFCFSFALSFFFCTLSRNTSTWSGISLLQSFPLFSFSSPRSVSNNM